MTQGKRYAILIGSSQFPDPSWLPELRCPENDVKGLAETLSAPESGLFADPLVFINKPDYEVRPAVNRVFSRATPQDQILVYYSGHGKQDKSGHLHLAMANTEADALEETSLAIERLRRLIDNYACKQVALILDCCFSGRVDKDFLKSGVDDQFQVLAQDRGVYILTASTATQTAREKDGDDFSLFTKHILHGLRHGEVAHNDDGLVSISDLYDYVRVRVPREAPQHPMKWEFGVRGNELFIARATALYSAEKLRAFRDVILGVEDEIDDDVFADSIRVIKQNKPKRDKPFFQLLDKLLAGDLRPGKFSSQWYKLAFGTSSASGQAIQTPNPAPKPIAEARQQTAKTASPSPPIPPRVRTVEEMVAGASLKHSASANGFTDDLNGVKLEMVYVPGGKFKMGTPKGSGHDDERPQHEVAVPAFYIGKFQVTQAQWQAVMGNNPSHFKGDDLPVENIPWNDAKEFCKKLAQITNKAYRLPSEAEWEYACRSGTTSDHAGKLDEMGWYSQNSDSKTHPVGRKKPNAFGLYDMHGNVWEWCEDVWHANYNGAPADGSAWMVGGNQDRRVVRGGSWGNNGGNCRSAYRLYDGPGFHDYVIGVRVVVSART